MVLRSQQIFDGILPETTDSTDPKIAKNRPKPQTVVATTSSGIPLADAPQLSRQEAESEETTTDDQSGEDSDPEVERARRAFLKAKKKKRAKTVNNVPLESMHKAPDELLKWVCHKLFWQSPSVTPTYSNCFFVASFRPGSNLLAANNWRRWLTALAMMIRQRVY